MQKNHYFRHFLISFVCVSSLFFSGGVFATENSGKMGEISDSGKIEILKSDENTDIKISGKYDAVGIEFSGLDEEIEISHDKGETWFAFEHSIDQKGVGDTLEKDDIQKFSELLFLPEISGDFRFKIVSDSESIPEKISFFFINTQKNDEILASANYSLPAAPYKRDDNFFLENGIIARSLWGADESLRYESGYVKPEPVVNNPPTQQTIRCQQLQTLYPEEFTVSRYESTEANKKLKWGYRYSPSIKKIAIHHTAENGAFAGDRTTEQVMRGIYQYHTTGRGWGDIGYNFVVSPDGKIFEGRAGGDFVVGGHIYCANVQTIGISLMGNFQEKQPTEKQIQSLQKLLRGLSKKYNIDPSAESMFHGKFTGNVVGHRDYGATACPGKNLYALISAIRYGVDLSGLSFHAQKLFERSAKFLSSISLKTLTAGEKSHYILQFKNTGNSSWKKDTWLFADLPSTDISIESVDGKSIFYAANLRENSVAPGKIGTFEVDIIAGFENGLHTVEFSPVVDSRRIKSASVVIPILVQNAEIKMEYQKFSGTVLPNKKSLSVSVDIINKGNSQFLQNDTLLKVQLENTVRFLKMKESSVGKNQVAHFTGVIPIVGAKNEKILSAILANRNGIISGAEKKTKLIIIDSLKVQKIQTAVSSFQKSWNAEISGLVRKKFQTSGKINTVPEKYFTVVNTGNNTWLKKEIQLVAIRKGERHILYMKESSVKPGKSAQFYLKGKTKMTSHQVFRLQLRYKVGYKIKKFLNGKFRWIVLPTGNTALTPSPSPQGRGGQILPPLPLEEGRGEGSENNKNIRIKLGYVNKNNTDTNSETNLKTNLKTNSERNVEFSGNFSVVLDGKIIMKNQKKFALFQSDNNIWGNGFSGKIFRIIPENSGVITVSSWDRIPSWDSTLNDNVFRGTLEARIYENKLVLINDLPLEDYLKGLAEVSNTAHPEKQKTIAVIARSYAQFYMFPENNKYPNKKNVPFDGDDSPASFQKYLGYGYEKRSPKFSNAVIETTGITVKYNNKTVKTPFFSESAGRTFSAQEKWGWTHTPYLVSVDDTFCKNGKGTQKGHGVGLSGCGAETMAEQGKKYPEILKYYYKGVSVGR